MDITRQYKKRPHLQINDLRMKQVACNCATQTLYAMLNEQSVINKHQLLYRQEYPGFDSEFVHWCYKHQLSI